MTGAHGTGKSVTLDRIQEINPSAIYIDPLKIPRTVLARSGLTLEQATATPELAKTHQENILALASQHYDTITSFEDNNVMLCDRSVVDYYAYTRLWAEQNGIEQSWVDSFKSKCIDLLKLYDTIFLFPTGVFKFVDDGVRAKEDTQLVIAQYMEEFINENFPSHHVVQSVSIDDRANEIITIIKNGTNSTTTP